MFRKPDKPEVPEEYRAVVEAFQPTNAMADAMGWPAQWLICQHCGEWSWRLPPHIFDPCPLVVDAAQTQGLKMDAERSMAVRAGINFEKQAQAFTEYMGRLLDEEDE
jgi:hypothetical protein